MSKLLEGIECVIFDFGEVLLELDYTRVISGFSNISNKHESAIQEVIVTAPLLQEFEMGQITAGEFRSGVNDLLGMSLKAGAFDKIWNSMLKHLPRDRMNLLKEVNDEYETFILSNSNVIHEEAFNKMIYDVTGKSSLHDCVSKCYFSQDIGLRKPNQNCYEYVINEIGVAPEKMLFLDDRSDNIEGAKLAGLNVFQVTSADEQLHTIFKNE